MTPEQLSELERLEREAPLAPGWLRRGLESANAESKLFPEHRRVALQTDAEFPIGGNE